MAKKIRYLLILVPMLFAMGACSSLKLPGIASTTSQNQPGQAMDLADQPVENKLAIGTLQLEGTDKAITAEQAKNLLPLWKAVKSLSSSTTASSDEIAALYTQIQENMTADQVQAIKDLSLSQEEMQALMQKYGVQGGPQGGNFAGLTDEQKATMEARRSSNSSGSNAGGGGPADGGGMPGGGMPPDGGGMPPDGAGGGFPGAGQANAQGTPSASQANRPSRSGGLNSMLVDPLIKLLEERAG